MLKQYYNGYKEYTKCCTSLEVFLESTFQLFFMLLESLILHTVYTACCCFDRCSFALILLSELVAELCSVDWSPHLPLLLHMVILGLDLHRPLVFEHSKKLLGNLLVVLACKNDKVAALQAR